MDAQRRGDTVEGPCLDHADVVEGHANLHGVLFEARCPAGAVHEQGQAGPGLGQPGLGALWDVDHLQGALAASRVRLQHHPVGVPDIAIIAGVAVAVLVEQGGVVKVGVGGHGKGLDAALSLLFAETDRVRCGQRLLADRLFEVVLLQLLRWLLDHPQEAGIQPGLITGLSDPRLARALVAVHESPGAPWSLERMAASAGMSRTAFANAFRDVVGQTPADYLTDWRMALAQARLREGRPLKALAEELGYANASALSRAFAARTGLSPREWLKLRTIGA